MEKLTGKSQVQVIPIEKEDEGNILKNDANASVFQHNISLDLLGKQFHRSLDPNQPALIELQDQYYFSTGPEINFEVKPTSKESTEKRSLIKTKMNEDESCLRVDLKLKLSPPRSSSWISLPSSSQVSCMLDSDENIGGISENELPPLVVMGCTRCYMYMMLPKDDPNCLICKNPVLLDKFE